MSARLKRGPRFHGRKIRTLGRVFSVWFGVLLKGIRKLGRSFPVDKYLRVICFGEPFQGKVDQLAFPPTRAAKI